jgi:hypothetical protein
MATLNIPILNAASRGAFYFTVDLEGINYEFRFQLNAREQYWYFDLLKNGEQICSGVKCVINWPFLWRHSELDKPPGEIMLINSGEHPLDPGLTELGNQALLTYVEGN